MLTRILVASVELCSRRALAVVLAGIASAVLLALYCQRNLAVDTQTESLVSADAPWRKVDQALDAAFPSRAAQLLVLIDARTPEQADDAAAALTERLKANPALFANASNPAASPYFRRNGLLFSTRQELSDQLEQLVRAQPMIGMLALDPSTRGLFGALRLSLEGVERGETTLEPLESPLRAIARTVESVLDGSPQRLSWQTLLTNRAPSVDDLRRVLVVQPILDTSALEPGALASAAVRAEARALGLTPERGVRVRLTGPVALTDEEFASLTDRVGWIVSASLSLLALCIYLAVRSARLVLANLVTLAVGGIWTAAFAAAAIGTLNLISVAFGVLFS
ncbi:MAG TPA: hopanoid biosynthesis-associated RND transporter HpnN, partial [Myxococcota bacterium]|nr:hopanoid biosynthesis-associated RND transporter HpnN [Myxococcota bacterium]